MRILILLLAFAISFFNANAQTRRALMIGVDTYYPKDVDVLASTEKFKPKKISNLDGCVNDVLAVKEVLVSRFEFLQDNITTLLNEEASRKGIIESFEKLIRTSQKGDVVVIYYAGHGSQVKNSLSQEADKRDETMVPADAFKGIMHIRDKELAVLWQRLVDKGVVVTVIYDSCHSGSIGRGTLTDDPPKSRFTDPDTLDARDASIPPQPEKNGALIISAAQDDEVAMEQKDENGLPHGAFTYAFLQTIKTMPVNANASDVFSSIRAIMKYNGKKQEPVLAGNDERLKQTLFGIDKGSLSGKTMIAVIINSGDEAITLQGGYAAGLSDASTLFRLDENKDTLRLKITEMKGINQCMASVEKGNGEKIKPGDLFELESWSGGNAALKVFIPESKLGYDEIFSVAKSLSALGNNKSNYWITDPSKEAPTHTIFFNGSEWFLGTPDGKSESLGKKPNASTIQKKLPSGAKVFVSLPAHSNLLESISKSFVENNAVEITSTASEAQYFLTGRILNGRLEYALLLPGITTNDASDNPMPVRTDFIYCNPADAGYQACVDTLAGYSLKLAKLKAWLTLTGPSDDGSFPFYLALRNSQTKEVITQGEVYKNENFGLVLCADKDNLDYWDGSKRYVYVIAITSQGDVMLCYPLSSVENKFPRMTENHTPQAEVPLGTKSLITISEPLGVDTYIMLTSDEPLPNPNALASSGVKTRGISNSGLSALTNVGAGTRGTINTPANWSISRLSVVCKEKK
ncbi:MAG: caspase family protein [Bacteroidetes bacterium]|nr:caspase family protein [Bacteroidota bacterium]MBU1719485.1 caspase family protein [Bacteroidota bacterium]